MEVDATLAHAQRNTYRPPHLRNASTTSTLTNTTPPSFAPAKPSVITNNPILTPHATLPQPTTATNTLRLHVDPATVNCHNCGTQCHFARNCPRLYNAQFYRNACNRLLQARNLIEEFASLPDKEREEIFKAVKDEEKEVTPKDFVQAAEC
ncbi:hypothetical protein JR316_0001260 [Psilocybe cubensis]|uniref:CCHC-type domain-containing protein n=2 Tax=Psilocybe cubensis TaxID=181762 RepID=A0A8H7Y8Z4_PSICU|nr:hypothetical protein JR316_0001260 [Psilocybe cubensis]KAH9487191.1 hypothetical protein JR316_0001260 [Psilocybe cubensis]